MMSATKTCIRTALFTVVLLWAVTASVVLGRLFVEYRGPSEPYERLLWRMQEEGHDVGLLGRPPVHWREAAVLADRSRAIRQWLLSVVESPHEDPALRSAALGFFSGMLDATALLRVMNELIAWASAQSQTADGAGMAREIRTWLPMTAVEMGLPDEGVLDILKRADPQGWRAFLLRQTSSGRTEEIKARAKRLLEVASGAAPTEPAAPQPKPDQPPAPARQPAAE
jgi:hypothetical protein